MSPPEAQKQEDSSPTSPLSGLTVLVARPAEQQAGSLAQFEAAGAEVVSFAAIEIGPPPSWEAVDKAIDQLDRFRWIVFSSTNGVKYFFGRFAQRYLDIPKALRGTKIAVVGPGTAESLAALGLHADLVPPVFRAESLADALVPLITPQTAVLIVRASRGREVLAERIESAGAIATQVVAYTSIDTTREHSPDAIHVDNMLKNGKIDWIAVTSSAIARSLASIFQSGMKEAKLAAISPLTAEALESSGFLPTVVAREHTIPGLIAAIAHHVARTKTD